MPDYKPKKENPICPCCSGNAIEDFYVIKNAPIQSVVTLKSYKQAIAVPLRDLTLSFCNKCGFIFNRSFDESINFFGNGYEDQQGFSKTFTTFIQGVTTSFIQKHNISNKNIIEIGCGKGDFLDLICEIGKNKGIGIDPAYIPGRKKHYKNVQFLQEYYSEKHINLPKDVIVCRHTLEHIYQPVKLLQTINRSIKEKEPVILFFEVPNVTRILEGLVFWDIFYEHCGYYSPGSLAKLFRCTNFDVLDIYKEYDNQYLFIEARPAQKEEPKKHPLEESLHELKSSVRTFTHKVLYELKKWEDRLLKLKKENKKVVLWGGGSKAVGFLTHFNKLKLITYVVDINPFMQGNYIPGIGIKYVESNFLKSYKPDTIIIMNKVYETEIKTTLAEMNLFPTLICL